MVILMGFFNKFKSNEKETSSRKTKGFKYLDKLIHGSNKEIILDYDIELKTGFLGDKDYEDGIQLDVNNLVIDGNGHTIDGMNKIRIFNIKATNIILKNITFKNGSHRVGSAINIESNPVNSNHVKFKIQLIDCNFINNEGTYGAISNKGLLSLKNVTFEDNKSDKTFFDDMYNEGILIIEKIYSNQSKTLLNKSTVYLNENNPEANKIIYNTESGETINIINEDKSYKYLQDLIDSGASEIKLEHDIRSDLFKNETKIKITSYSEIKDLVIDGNGHTIDGLGSYDIFSCEGVNLVLKNIIMRNSECAVTSYSEHLVEIKDCDFQGHIDKIIYNSGNVRMINCKIAEIHNKKLQNLFYNKGKLEMISCILSDIVCSELVYNSNELKIRDCRISNNVINNGDGFKSEGKIWICGCEISDNKIENGSLISGLNDMSISDSVLSDNIVDKNESVMIIQCDTASINRTTFSNNKCQGAIIRNKKNLSLNEVIFNENNSDFDVLNDAKLLLGEIDTSQSETILNNHIIYLSDKYHKSPEMIQNSESGKLIEQNDISYTKDFRYLAGLVGSSEGEIKFEYDIEYDEFENRRYIQYDNSNIVINGNGHTIDARGKTSIFKFKSMSNVILKNIVFKNGYGDSGAAIHIGEYSNVQIIDCVFINNKGENGAIFNEGRLSVENITIRENNQDCSDIVNKGKLMCGDINFDQLRVLNEDLIYLNENNQLIYDHIQNRDDGVIINRLKDSLSFNQFKDLVKASKGELILQHDVQYNALNGSEWNVEIYASNLIIDGNDHVIDGMGESVHFEFHGKNITFKNFIFKNIIASPGIVDDGFITNEGSTKFLNCEFIENNSSECIFFNKGSLEFVETSFKDNVGKIICNEGFMSFIYGKFLDNNSEYLILNKIGNSSALIDRTLFENNYHDSKTPSQIINLSKLTLTSIEIKNGEKIISNENSLFIKDLSKDIEKNINNQGSIEYLIRNDDANDFTFLDELIHENESKKIVLNEDICFKNYEEDYYEGGIELDIDDLEIDGNGHTIDAMENTRIFLISANNVTLKNITFKNGNVFKSYLNSKNNYGGAIRTINGVKLTIENCNFENNKSDNGGAIYLRKSELYMQNCILSDNSGYSIFNGKGKVNIDDCELSFSNLYNQKGQIQIKHSSVKMGQYSMDEIIFNLDGELNIINSVFDGFNRGIYNDKGNVKIIDSTIMNCHSQGDGGAIFNNGSLFVKNSKLNKNHAEYGGAIFNTEGKSIIINSIFNDNHVKNYSACDNSGYRMNTDFSMGLSYGGAIHNTESGQLKVSDSLFSDNTAQFNGGALSSISEVEIENCSFLDNTATGYRDDIRGLYRRGMYGAIYVPDEDLLKLKNCNFKNNSPSNY